MRTGILFDGLRHLARGNFETPLRWFLTRLNNEPERYCTVDVNSVPKWVQGVNTVEILRDGNDYFSVLPQETDSIALDTIDEFQKVSFPLVGRSGKLPERANISIDTGTDSIVRLIDTGSSNARGIREYQVIISLPESTTAAEITVSPSEKDPERQNVSIGTPSALPVDVDQPPIVLVSVDALRYDYVERFDPVLNVLGPDAVVPDEPRTQTNWTAPAHGSMLTGMYPADHGYVRRPMDDTGQSPIDSAFTTIPELLHAHQYKCSGLVSHTRILPEYGFGRGFTRFRLQAMGYDDWLTRETDASHAVDEVCRWIERDSAVSNRLFYFLHVFDPHYPYVPPHPDHDLRLDLVKQYSDTLDSIGRYPDRVRAFASGRTPEIDPDGEIVELLRSYYAQSVEYTAKQVARLLTKLESVDLLDEALVIITGDHGEEFMERGFPTHKTLYDDCIRPGMIVKPPDDADWKPPDDADLIDILPTIATAVGTDPPSQVDGRAWQASASGSRPRFAERIYEDSYSVAVEVDGTKGIFTYEGDYPGRPSDDELGDGPLLKEFYSLRDVREGNYDNLLDTLDAATADTLRRHAREFAGRTPKSEDGPVRSGDGHRREVEEQLEDLGYL